MADEVGLSREAFLHVAQASGLDAKDPHMEDLYRHVQSVLASIRGIWELDVADVEPATIFISSP